MYNKKINKLLIGTNNSGKLREIKDLLPKRTKIFSTKYFKLKSPRENGKTFFYHRNFLVEYFLSLLSTPKGL